MQEELIYTARHNFLTQVTKSMHFTPRSHLSKLYAIVAMKLEAAVFLAAWQG